MLNEIKSRYTKESSTCSNLSCGSNLDLLNIIKGESILDLGCGRGNDTIQAAMLTGIEGKAVGLDITQSMIDAAHANAEGIGISNVWFIKGDIENIPFDEAVFDAVISNCAINHAKSKKKVYVEIYRVLKKGGRFVISDVVSKNPLPEEIKNNPEAWAQCFGGAVTEKEYLAAITSSGFTNIEILNRREYIKNGYDFISFTIRAAKQGFGGCLECSV